MMQPAPSLAACLLLAALPLRGQVVPTSAGLTASPLAASYRVNFAIPDAPAFELLQVDPSTILRPQTVRELAVGFGSFRDQDGDFTVPRALAIEISPGMLMRSGDLRLTDYLAKKFLYALRLSAAALRDSAGPGPGKLALGLRMTLADEADFRTDAAYATGEHVTDLTARILAVYEQARMRAGPRGQLVLLPQEEELIARVNEQIRERWAARYWNADVADVAFAARAGTADSAGHDPKIDALAVWGTYAKGLGGWGQALLGLKLGTERDSLDGELRQSTSIASRLYFGSNRYKGFLEVQQTSLESRDPAWLFNSGFELAVSDWIWANFTAGIEDRGGDAPSRAVTSLKLKTGLPDLLR